MKYQDDSNAQSTSLTEAGTVNIESYSNPPHNMRNVEGLFGRIVLLFTGYHRDHLLHELHLAINNTCE